MKIIRKKNFQSEGVGPPLLSDWLVLLKEHSDQPMADRALVT